MPKKRDANRTHAFQYFGLVEWAKYHLSTAVPLTFCQLFIHFISIVFLIMCLNFFFRVHSGRISLIHLPIFETHSEPSVYQYMVQTMAVQCNRTSIRFISEKLQMQNKQTNAKIIINNRC